MVLVRGARQINQRLAKTKPSKGGDKGTATPAPAIAAAAAEPAEPFAPGTNPYLAAGPEPERTLARDRSKAFRFIERGTFERRAAELRAKVWAKRVAHPRARGVASGEC